MLYLTTPKKQRHNGFTETLGVFKSSPIALLKEPFSLGTNTSTSENPYICRKRTTAYYKTFRACYFQEQKNNKQLTAIHNQDRYNSLALTPQFKAFQE